MRVQDKLYEAIAASSDQRLIELVKADRVKFYDYPATAPRQMEYIVIDPIGAEAPAVFGDNVTIALSQMFQVEVRGACRVPVHEIAQAIKEALEPIGLIQKPGGVDEYDKELDVYRDARRYDGEIEIEEMFTQWQRKATAQQQG